MANALPPTALLALLLPALAGAACPPSCPLPGGGNPAQDCHAEFASIALHPNFPPTRAPANRREVRCFDGEPGCDLDGVVDDACVFDIDVCLRNADPALPGCTAADVTAVRVGGGSSPDLAALEAALTALLPAAANVCTSGQTLRVPLAGPDRLGRFRRASRRVTLSARTAAGVDGDRVKLTCVPHGWPSHGYNHANHRASAQEGTLNPGNAGQLVVKWDLDLQALEGPGLHAVTSTPTVGNGLVYVTAWNGNIYAVRPSNGTIKWKYDTADTFIGLQSSATLTADGRLVVGDSTSHVYCLDARTGALLWQTTVGDPAGDHFWSSPVVANNRVFVGIASHTDVPCVQGRLVALDLETGAPLWTLETVPDRICRNDTAITCDEDADCSGVGGSCIAGIGGGVTATVAVDATGETVYMNTVGCYTFPSIGDSDSIFRIQAATGEVDWKTRVQPPEQFGFCSNDSSIDCGTNAVCGAGTCTTKSFYHDFGFLNGPLIVEADDGLGGTRTLVVSGSKDGSLYALDPANGSPVWTRPVLPTPVSPGFAGFGLFNGAVGFADQRFHAALYQQIPGSVPNHLMAFSAADGSTVWEDDIGISWGSVGIAGGLVFVGSQAATDLFVYDAATGTRLNTIAMPDNVTSGASIVDGTVYVGYGVLSSTGGVRALALP
jgi:outer membrane protein assembly factor BamB